MKQERTLCPVCEGKKMIPGVCECDSEWRGTQSGDDWEDCQCTEEEQCTNCNGTGYVDQ